MSFVCDLYVTDKTEQKVSTCFCLCHLKNSSSLFLAQDKQLKSLLKLMFHCTRPIQMSCLRFLLEHLNRLWVFGVEFWTVYSDLVLDRAIFKVGNSFVVLFRLLNSTSANCDFVWYFKKKVRVWVFDLELRRVHFLGLSRWFSSFYHKLWMPIIFSILWCKLYLKFVLTIGVSQNFKYYCWHFLS